MPSLPLLPLLFFLILNSATLLIYSVKILINLIKLLLNPRFSMHKKRPANPIASTGLPIFIFSFPHPNHEFSHLILLPILQHLSRNHLFDPVDKQMIDYKV